MAPCSPTRNPASLSLYPWDKRLIPQGVKGKINHPGGSSVSPLTWQGKKTKRNRVSCGLVGSPIKGGKCLLCDSEWAIPVPVTSGNRCSCASAEGGCLLSDCPSWRQISAAPPAFPAQLPSSNECFSTLSLCPGAWLQKVTCISAAALTLELGELALASMGDLRSNPRTHIKRAGLCGDMHLLSPALGRQRRVG